MRTELNTIKKMSSKISDHISYTEATKSPTAERYGINNRPDAATLISMKHVAENVFEKLRAHFCVPIAISSFYRSPALNTKVGGSKNSQHVKGEAMDLDADILGVITNKQIFDYIRKNLDYDQLIWEFGDDKNPAWVHVSLKCNGINRKQTLQAYKEKSWSGTMITKYKNI